MTSRDSRKRLSKNISQELKSGLILENEQCWKILSDMKLTEIQEKVISHLANSTLNKKFYWTGGTLLAYHYLHHRKSLDLDFFSEEEFLFEKVNQLVEQIKKNVGFKKVSFKKIFDRFEFIFENGEILRIEFVYYNHEKKTLKKRNKILGVYVDSLEDIAANKTMAYFDRNEPKDLFDLYFLLHKGGFNPSQLLKLVDKKFGVSFNEALFWSEAFKSLPLLRELKPLMLEKEERQQEALLEKIEEYFKDGSYQLLSKTLK